MITIEFDKPWYAPDDMIVFQVVVTDEPMESSVTVTGTVTTSDGTELPAEATTTIRGIYGEFVIPGYTVEPHASGTPGKFVAVPVEQA